MADKSSTFKCNEKFDYPNIPLKKISEESSDEKNCDWRKYPRNDVNSDLCTLRINPNDKFVTYHVQKILLIIIIKVYSLYINGNEMYFHG